MYIVKATILLILLTSVCEAGSKCKEHILNNFSDLIIKELIKIFPKQYMVANITNSYLFGIARLEAFDGTLKDLSTVERQGDLVVTMNNETAVIDLNVTFNLLSVYYDKYMFKMLGMTLFGTLRVNILDNLFHVRLKMGEESQCLITIEKVDILKLSSFDVKTESYCDLCSEFTSSAFSAVTNYFKSMITDTVNDRLKKIMKQMFTNNNLYVCST